MYEIICPACRKMVEVPAQVAIIGAQCKCPKCWTVLEVVNDHPLRMVISNNPLRRVVRATSSTSRFDRSGSDE